MEECVGIIRPELERTGTTVEVFIPRTLPPLAVDPLQIEQVFTNLMRNAVEAVAAAKPVGPRIAISASEAPNGRVQVAFTDNGVGFPAGFTLRTTRPIESTKIDGLGIGLSLSRSIVENHGGTLEIDPGRPGATVRVTLPIAVTSDSGAEA
jgi:two-component system sensor histidine kinase DctS